MKQHLRAPGKLLFAVAWMSLSLSVMSQEKIYRPVDIGQHIDPNGVGTEFLPDVSSLFFADKDDRGKIVQEVYLTLLAERNTWMASHRQEYLDRYFSNDPLFQADQEAPIEIMVKEFSKDMVRVAIVFTIGHSRWHQYVLVLRDYLIDRNKTVDRIFRLKQMEERYAATFMDIGHGSTFAAVLRAFGLNYREYAGQSPQYRELWFPGHDLEVVIQDGLVKYLHKGKPAWVDQASSGFSPDDVGEGSDVLFSCDHFTIRYLPGLGFGAVDTNGLFLFEVVPFDNGPDYPSEGLIRIRENGKIGYADLEGRVVIVPAFDCAYPFQDGVALICAEGTLVRDGEHETWKEACWGAIDRTGKIIVDPFDLGLFTFDILELKLALLRQFAGGIITETRWGKLDEISIFVQGEGEGLFVDLVSRETGKLLLTYLYLPWQDLTLRTASNHDARIPTEQLVTVTSNSIVYLVDMAPMLSEGEMDTITDLANLMYELLGVEEMREVLHEADGISTPSGIRIISLREHPNYLEVSVAAPGTGMLSFDSLRMELPRKMILLHQVPDQGSVRSNWIRPGPPEDYNSGEMVGEGSEAAPMFPDYVPKRTPDTMLDYMPSLLAELARIPEPELSHLHDLISLYTRYKEEASANPGMWVDGNLLLGAREKEYRPSPAELLLMEVGERIGTVISESDPELLEETLGLQSRTPELIEYTRFFFIHYDVMGSGRFFYIDGMEKVSLKR